MSGPSLAGVGRVGCGEDELTVGPAWTQNQAEASGAGTVTSHRADWAELGAAAQGQPQRAVSPALPGGLGRPGARTEFGAVSLVGTEVLERKADVVGMHRMGGSLGVSCWIAQLLRCRGVNGTSSFCQVREGGGQFGKEERKGSLRRGTRLLTDQRVCGGLPTPIPGNQRA